MNRRSFLEATSALGAGLLVGPTDAFGRVVARNDTINVGLIGTGSRGGGLLKLLKEIPSFNVMACCDILPDRLQGALDQAGTQAKAYDDYRKLLEDKSIDAVVIATPLYLHSQMAIDVLESGKHVYCEKTMAYTAAQAVEVVRAVRRHQDLIFQVGHQYHYSPLYHTIVEMVQQGYIGTVTGFECTWNRNGDWRRQVLDARNEKLVNWRMYRDYSCGLLGELSSHQIDFVNWLTKSHPTGVIGSGGIDYWKDGRETFDNVHVIFDYPQGIKASFTCTTANAFDGYQIKILGDQATIVVKQDRAFIHPEADREAKESGTVDGVTGATVSSVEAYGPIPINVDGSDPSKQSLLAFAECIRNRRQPLSNVLTGANVSFCVRMALEAATEKRFVQWQDSYDL